MQCAESDRIRIKRQDKRNLNEDRNDNVYFEFCMKECLATVMQLKLGLNSARGELKKDGSSIHELIELGLFSMNLYTVYSCINEFC